MIPTEHAEQASLFSWRDLAAGQYPELVHLYSIPNANKRSIRAGVWMRNEGLTAGIPDVCLPVARVPYGALYIEMKRLDGPGPTPHQYQKMVDLQTAGNCALWCRGWLAARDVLLAYLAGEPLGERLRAVREEWARKQASLEAKQVKSLMKARAA